jgi:hypothetical protein
MSHPNGRTGTAPDAAAETPANLRPVLRAGAALALRAITNITKFAGGDLRSGLVFQAVWTSNLRPVTQTAANETYGGLGTLPPEELIRPIAVHALSESLLIPYETTRRHVTKLIKDGLCVRDHRGVRIAMTAIATRPEIAAVIQNALPSLLLFLDELRRADFDFAPYRQSLPVTVSLPASGGLPANGRGLLRVCSEYVMRCIDVLGRLYANDFLAALIHSAIWIANTESIRQGPENLQYGALNDIPPDSLRKPISVNALASQLGMPFETTRRYVNTMLHEGMVVRTDKGLVVPARVIGQPLMLECARAVHAHTVRLVADLHRAGFDFSGY